MANEKRPTWVTIVAVVAIIFSSFGLLGATQQIVMPQMAEFQKKFFNTMTSEIRSEIAKQPTPADPEARQAQETVLEMFDMIESMFNYPEWYKTWMVIAGIIGLFVYGFYLLAAIWFLQLKRKSIPMIYIAFILSIVLGITNTVVTARALSALAILLMSGGLIGIVIEIVLLIVVLSSNKQCFTN